MNSRIVYSYHPVFKYFLNTENAQEDPQAKGTYLLPAHSTEIIPPVTQEGEIAVYNESAKTWSITKDIFMHPDYKEKNFSTGKFVSLPVSIDHRLLGTQQLILSPIMTKLIARFYKVNEYYEVNPQTCILGIASTMEPLNKRIINIQNKFCSIKKKKIISPQELIDFNIELEQIIHIIKRIIDEIIIMFCITHDIQNINKTNKILFLSIRDMFGRPEKEKRAYKALRDDIRKSINYDNFRPFLEVINELHNAYKHDICNVASRNIVGMYEVTVHAINAPYGNLNDITYINCSLGQLVTGFNEFMLNITEVESFNGQYKYEIAKNPTLLSK